MEAQQASDIQVMIDPAIFNDAYRPHLDNMARIQIFFGGASSGKSVFVVGQRPVIDIMAGGRNYLICRAVGRTIRRSIFNQVERTIQEFGVSDLFHTNKSELSITCMNGYQILFAGLDDPEKIKSITPEKGAITDIVIEEATECSLSTVKQLMKRQRGGDKSIPKRLVLLFNPILQDHWIFSEYFAPVGWDEEQTEYTSDEMTILRTWFEHNRFLTDADRADLLGEQDKYYRDVYTWGKFGVLGNVIFTNWEIQDLSKMRDQFTNVRAGLDFGYADSPAAFFISHYDKTRKRIYVYDEFYDTEVSDEELASEVLDMIGKTTIVCDSAEPKSIAKLRELGVDARPAKKGPDSVNFGIKWLGGGRSEEDKKKSDIKIVLDTGCVKFQNELRQYKWREGQDGKLIMRKGKPVPVDANNHLIDALRYAYEGDMITLRVTAKASAGNYMRRNREKDTRPAW